MVVELQGVTKRYDRSTAVEDISFTVSRGEFVTLLGPSGSGKTTLLNLIVGKVAPTAGKIIINGQDATHLEPGKRDIGMVFQNYALMPHMTVFENVAFPLQIRKLPKQEIAKRVNKQLEAVGLLQFADRHPRQLSGGQQQRVSLARCLVYNPSLILMDEPLGALDRNMREQMQLEIRRLHADTGVTILYVTHDQEEALTMSDQIILMNHGKIEQKATPDELYRKPVSVFAAQFLGDSNLFAGEVEDTGNIVSIRGLNGIRLQGRIEQPAVRGDSGHMLVRPENLTIKAEKIDGPNCLEGICEDSILLGGVVKHRIRLPGSKEVVVQELNRDTSPRIRHGDATWVSWRAEDALFIPSDKTPAPAPTAELQ